MTMAPMEVVDPFLFLVKGRQKEAQFREPFEKSPQEF